MGNGRLYSTHGSYLISTQFLAPWPLLKKGIRICLECVRDWIEVHEDDRSLYSSYFLCLVESPTNTQQLLFCFSVCLLKRISRMDKIVFISFCQICISKPNIYSILPGASLPFLPFTVNSWLTQS
jgi:hypothetical protein